MSYRTGFLLALIGNIILAVVAGALWLHFRHSTNARGGKSNFEGSPGGSDSNSAPAASESSEARLVPVQISAQRLQSIGVKTGKVETKAGRR